jgi:hypothetical protein
VSNEHLAELADTAAKAVEQAAQDAHRCAERAWARATATRGGKLVDARGTADVAATREAEARDRYHRSADRNGGVETHVEGGEPA